MDETSVWQHNPDHLGSPLPPNIVLTLPIIAQIQPKPGTKQDWNGCEEDVAGPIHVTMRLQNTLYGYNMDMVTHPGPSRTTIAAKNTIDPPGNSQDSCA